MGDDGDVPLEEQEEQDEQFLRPILVGYAFGPKKMSTMGVVMAEASRALSAVTMEATRTTVAPAFAGGSLPTDGSRSTTGTTGIVSSRNKKKKHQLDEEDASQATATTVASSSAALHIRTQSTSVVTRLTPAALERRDSAVADMMGDSSSATITPLDMESQSQMLIDDVCSNSNSNATTTNILAAPGIRISIGGPGASGTGGIRNIIRFFQSNCSSADAASFAGSSITTTTAGVGGAGGGGGGIRSCRSGSVAGSAQSSGTGHYSARSIGGDGEQQRYADGTKRQAVRVSFVPLDLDLPLEEQHGGRFDAILHKMTEDILHLSIIQDADNITNSSTKDGQPANEQAQRIGRLTAYKSSHPACCLVDHPTYVQGESAYFCAGVNRRHLLLLPLLCIAIANC